jgi:hypothetical protein
LALAPDNPASLDLTPFPHSRHVRHPEVVLEQHLLLRHQLADAVENILDPPPAESRPDERETNRNFGEAGTQATLGSTPALSRLLAASMAAVIRVKLPHRTTIWFMAASVDGGMVMKSKSRVRPGVVKKGAPENSAKS